MYAGNTIWRGILQFSSGLLTKLSIPHGGVCRADQFRIVNETCDSRVSLCRITEGVSSACGYLNHWSGSAVSSAQPTF